MLRPFWPTISAVKWKNFIRLEGIISRHVAFGMNSRQNRALLLVVEQEKRFCSGFTKNLASSTANWFGGYFCWKNDFWYKKTKNPLLALSDLTLSPFHFTHLSISDRASRKKIKILQFQQNRTRKQLHRYIAPHIFVMLNTIRIRLAFSMRSSNSPHNG